MGVPISTYRLQLNREFPWSQAASIVDYLKDLGIGAAYVSPICTARPGSRHGYDVVDPSRLNPDLGSEADMLAFATGLRERGLGLIVDVVPNHMSIWGSANRYWNDVLENGQSSPFARWFDVDWTPPKPDLEAKVLLPVLGDQFGRVLEAGEIRVTYDAGAFFSWYHDMRLPVAPKTWPQILQPALSRLSTTLGEGAPEILEFESIITALDHLPPRTETDPQRVRERLRDREVSRRRIETLAQAQSVRDAIEAALVHLNGRPEDPHSFDALETLLDQQGYRLSHWRVAAEEINYRRFFDINELAAIRVEEPAVFEAIHEIVLGLVRAGRVTGLRVDHVDGLWDPEAYLNRLQRALDSASGGEAPYLVVEKILEPGERLHARWPVHGTTGYDFLHLVGGLFVDGAGMKALTGFEAVLAQKPRRLADVAYEAKKLVLRVALSAELTVLSRRLDRISEQHRASRDFTLQSLHEALGEVIACFPVYRTYVRMDDQSISPNDRVHVEAAVRAAKQRNPATSPSVFDFLCSLLLLEDPPGLQPRQREERREFVLRLQQLTAPVMAKGLEDTTFYRYFPLAGLNEVGGPTEARGLSTEAWHKETLERLRLSRHGMLSTGTHDTKRGEDLRARLFALSELSDEWILGVNHFRDLNRELKTASAGELAPDDVTEYLIYQTIIGAWPAVSPFDMSGFVARLQAYMTKAAREAKSHTSWINPNAPYEDALRDFVAAILDPVRSASFLENMGRLQARIARIGYLTSLSQTLLKIASPGMPDFYQGDELWDLSLVDPDNRRPVDYPHRRALLASLRHEALGDAATLAERLLAAPEDGRVKLFVIYRALALRAARMDAFRDGGYEALSVTGSRASHVVAFARTGSGLPVIALAGRFFASLTARGTEPLRPASWGDTEVHLGAAPSGSGPAPRFREALTGRFLTPVASAGGLSLCLSDAFAQLPVALVEVVT